MKISMIALFSYLLILGFETNAMGRGYHKISMFPDGGKPIKTIIHKQAVQQQKVEISQLPLEDIFAGKCVYIFIKGHRYDVILNIFLKKMLLQERGSDKTPVAEAFKKGWVDCQTMAICHERTIGIIFHLDSCDSDSDSEEEDAKKAKAAKWEVYAIPSVPI